MIRNLYPTFYNKGCEIANLLREDAGNAELEFGSWCTRATLDVIGISSFGRDFGSLKNPEDEFAVAYNQLLEPDKSKALYFVLILIFSPSVVQWIPFWDVPRMRNKISNDLHKFAYNLARERRVELNNPKLGAEELEHKNDILSLLVKSNDFTDEQLAHQILTKMAPGHETTSSALGRLCE